MFKPTPSNFRQRYSLENKFIILGVANVWTANKGLQYFRELSRHLSTDEVIVLVGLTEKQKPNLPPRIIGITKTDSVTALAEIYATADVFVNPTLEDTFPTTNLEALACGTPVITFNTGGSVESVSEGCGYIVPQASVDTIISCIRDISKLGKTTYTRECLERANRLYDKKGRYMEYIHLYADLLPFSKQEQSIGLI